MHAADSELTSATFLFADIAGFTAMTEVHGDAEAARIVAEFSAAVERELPAIGGTHVKTIGDALMLRIPDPGDAVLLGLKIALDVLRGHRAPAVRVGLHHGPAIERHGDYFGATVNLAARVSATATGGEVMLTGATAALARHLEGVRYESRGCPTLRNVRGPVELVAAVRQGQTREHRFTIDPVCRMAVDPEHAAGGLVIDDTVYFFCSLACAGEFARQPAVFID
jgi:class 3 adenylate cyclase/YHS domain-containing protein